MDMDVYEQRKAQLQKDLDATREKANRIEKRLKMLENLKDPADQAIARELLTETGGGLK